MVIGVDLQRYKKELLIDYNNFGLPHAFCRHSTLETCKLWV